MSVPQTPTLWTRTRASPAAGFAGSAISIRFQFRGESSDKAFIVLVVSSFRFKGGIIRLIFIF